jgi:glycosyltransferase involved in cell wall biosynthesis
VKDSAIPQEDSVATLLDPSSEAISSDELLNNGISLTRVAWLLQGAGAYWQPIMSNFTRLYPETIVFTADWNDFLPGFEDSFKVVQVGTMKVFSLPINPRGYNPSFTHLPLGIVRHLLRYRPQVIFTTAFSIWTILVLLLKVLLGWRVVIVYDGSSPGVDYQGSKLRMFLRRKFVKLADACITNNKAGELYLTKVLGARDEETFCRPYLVPDPLTYQPHTEISLFDSLPLIQPVFIFVGHVIPRKGLRELLQACMLLREKGYGDYTLLVVGDGVQRLELESFVDANGLKNQIRWIGHVPYEQVGAYLQKADVFIFPTLEDVWGLVAVEAMMFGKPILCSKWAGAVELVMDGENGYVFDPHEPEKLAELMRQFLEEPSLIKSMGMKSKQIMASHTPQDVANFLSQVVKCVLHNEGKSSG